MPNASVTKPGASISVPPTRISAPSAISVAGIRPLPSASRSARQARAPSCLISQVPRMLSSDQQRDRPPGADHLPDLDEHVDLDQRHHDEDDEQRALDHPAPAGHWRLIARTTCRADLAAALAQAPRGDPLERLGRDRAAHLGVAAHPLDELDRHLADGQAGRERARRPCRSGRRSRWTAPTSRSIFSSVVRRNSRKPAVASRTFTPSSRRT